MRRYREFRRHQFEKLKEAIEQGNISLANRILKEKPHISISGHKTNKKVKKYENFKI